MHRQAHRLVTATNIASRFHSSIYRNSSGLLSHAHTTVRPSSTTTSQPQPSTISSTFLTEKDYHHLADSTLEDLVNATIDSGLDNKFDDADISLEMGVLNLNLGHDKGFWVINKQTPNKQIWLSSPISGPRRFDYCYNQEVDKVKQGYKDTHRRSDNWICSRQKHTRLFSLLKDELLVKTGVDISVDVKQV